MDQSFYMDQTLHVAGIMYVGINRPTLSQGFHANLDQVDGSAFAYYLIPISLSRWQVTQPHFINMCALSRRWYTVANGRFHIAHSLSFHVACYIGSRKSVRIHISILGHHCRHIRKSLTWWLTILFLLCAYFEHMKIKSEMGMSRSITMQLALV